MKLLRLTTTDQKGYFDTSINDGILLKPNSKIALQSLTMEQEDSFLQINSANDTFTWSSQNGQSVTITFPHQAVTAQNFGDWLNTFTRLLNNSCYYDFNQPFNSILAMEWDVNLTQENKVMIQHRKAAVSEHSTYWETEADVNRDGNGVWALNGPQDQPDLEAFSFNMLAPVPVSYGNGFLRCQLNKAVFNPGGNQRQGVVIGFSKTNLGEIESADFTEDMMDYGLAVILNDPDSEYRAQTKNVFSGVLDNVVYVGEGDAANDYIEIMKNGTIIQMRVYDAAGVRFEYDFTERVESNEKLYPFIVFHETSDYISINKVRSTWSYFDNPALAQGVTDTPALGAPPQPSAGNTNNFINFNTIDLAEFLGFPTIRRPEVGFEYTRDAQFEAPELFKPRYYVQSMIIEMLNLKLDSYDGYPTQEQRKSILAFIPTGNQERVTIYEKTQNFIDLNNKDPILLRNIRARIVQGDYSEITLIGQASIVLVIDSD